MSSNQPEQTPNSLDVQPTEIRGAYKTGQELSQDQIDIVLTQAQALVENLPNVLGLLGHSAMDVANDFQKLNGGTQSSGGMIGTLYATGLFTPQSFTRTEAEWFMKLATLGEKAIRIAGESGSINEDTDTNALCAVSSVNNAQSIIRSTLSSDRGVDSPGASL